MPSRYVLDDATNLNPEVTDAVKLVTVEAKPKPAVAPVTVPLADADFWTVFSVVAGILGFVIALG